MAPEDPRSGAGAAAQDEAPSSPLVSEVRTRRIVRGDGESQLELTVRCQRRGEVVAYHACEQCGENLVRPEDPLEEAARLECQGPAKPVEGVPTSSQVTHVAREALSVPVREVMTRSVVCVTPDVTAQALITLLAEEGIGGVPVVTPQGTPVGMVSQSDLVWESYEQGEGDDWESGVGSIAPSTRVADLMSSSALSVLETTPIVDAAALMSFEGIHRLPVVDEQRRVVGIVTALDLLAWVSRHAGYPVPQRLPRGRRAERSVAEAKTRTKPPLRPVRASPHR